MRLVRFILSVQCLINSMHVSHFTKPIATIYSKIMKLSIIQIIRLMPNWNSIYQQDFTFKTNEPRNTHMERYRESQSCYANIILEFEIEWSLDESNMEPITKFSFILWSNNMLRKFNIYKCGNNHKSDRQQPFDKSNSFIEMVDEHISGNQNIDSHWFQVDCNIFLIQYFQENFNLSKSIDFSGEATKIFFHSMLRMLKIKIKHILKSLQKVNCNHLVQWPNECNDHSDLMRCTVLLQINYFQLNEQNPNDDSNCCQWRDSVSFFNIILVHCNHKCSVN